MVTPSWMVVQHFIPYSYTHDSFWSNIWTEATSVLSYLPGSSKVQAVDLTLTSWEAILRTLKEYLFMAHNCMKQQVDQGRSKRQFAEGD